MTIVGVHITKVNAERNMKSVAQKVGINNNISVKEVSEMVEIALKNAKKTRKIL